MKYIFSESKVHGIGCIATENIKKNEIVAREPYFLCDTKHKEFLDYYWNGKNKKSLLINGLGCYCNHSNNSNIKPIINTENSLIKFIALCDIKEGEELFCNYGKKYWNSRNMSIDNNNKITIIKKKVNNTKKVNNSKIAINKKKVNNNKIAINKKKVNNKNGYTFKMLY